MGVDVVDGGEWEAGLAEGLAHGGEGPGAGWGGGGGVMGVCVLELEWKED